MKTIQITGTSELASSETNSELASARDLVIILHLADSKAGRGVEKLYVRKGEGFRCALIGDC